PAAEKTKVDEAMQRSAFTRDRVTALRDGLSEAGLAPNIVERAARYVFMVGKGALEFLRGATEPLAAPQIAWATRSTQTAADHESFYEFMHAFGAIQAHLKIEHVAQARID